MYWNKNVRVYTICVVLLCICVHFIIITFSKQAFHESLDFSTVHSLMNDKND